MRFGITQSEDSAAHKQQPEYLSHVDGKWIQSIDNDAIKLLWLKFSFG